MILLKSFYRKKTTKIYLGLMCLIAISCSSLLLLKKHYIGLINDNYSSSFIMFEVDKNTMVTNLDNVNIIYRGLATKDILYPIIEWNEKNIQDNEVLISSDFNNQFKIGEEISLTIFNNTVNKELKIIEFYNTDKFIKPFFINSNTFNQLIKEESKILYIGKIKNWLYEKKTVKKIEEELNIQVMEFISKNHESNYDEIVSAINLFTILVILSFIFLNILLTINVIYDERKSNLLYRSLGFSTKKIYQILIYKIGSMIGLSIILASIVICLGNN